MVDKWTGNFIKINTLKLKMKNVTTKKKHNQMK